MAIFSDKNYKRIDYELLVRNGCITLFHLSEILNEYVEKLKNLNYKIVEFDCQTWESRSEMYEQISQKLIFPEYFGRNLDALNDCLCDIEIPEESGKVLIFRKFDDFARKDYDFAWAVLDIITVNSQMWLLFGKRLFVLIQSDDKEIQFDNLGAKSARWNRKES